LGEHTRILIVDDDESIRTVLLTILADKGYSTDTARTGREAIKKTNTKLYNLALIDIRLPDMEGTQLLTQMKSRTPRMRKVIMTGYPSLNNAVDALNMGADAYVMKPFDMEKVLATIKDQFEKQKEEMSFSQERVAEFIETRVKELETENAKKHTLCFS
jgi:two-component system NtrC family response regulator